MESGIGRIGPGTAGAPSAPASRARGDANDAEDAKLKEACRELESVFLEILISEMRRTAPRDALFGGGRGEDMFQDMFDQEIAKKMAARGGIGLADILYGQLKRMTGT